MEISHSTIPREHRQSVARIVLAIALVLLGCWILQGFLRSLLWAGILAIAFAPFYERVRHRLPRQGHDVLLPLVFTAAVTLVVIVPLALIAVQLGREGTVGLHWLQDLRQDGLPAPAWLDRVPLVHDQVRGWWTDNLSDPESVRALLGRVGRLNPMTYGRAVGAAVFHRSIEFVFTVVALFFLFREGPRLADKVLFVCRSLFGPQGEPVARQLVASIHGTVDGLVLVGLGVGAILGVAYAIAGAPHPVLLGFLTAVGAIFPMGATLALLVASGLVLAGGQTIAAAVLFVFGMAVIFVADHAIRPGLIGSATRLPFLWVLLGILGGVETFGLLGLFLGPAVMSALILLWREWTKDATTEPAPIARST